MLCRQCIFSQIKYIITYNLCSSIRVSAKNCKSRKLLRLPVEPSVLTVGAFNQD